MKFKTLPNPEPISIIGFILALAIAITDIKIIYKYAWLPFIISIILLLILYLSSNQGVNRWLDLGAIKIQPSEIAKISIILALARYFHDINVRDYGKVLYSIFALLIARDKFLCLPCDTDVILDGKIFPVSEIYFFKSLIFL